MKLIEIINTDGTPSTLGVSSQGKIIMAQRIHTIWHYGMAFFEDAYQMRLYATECDDIQYSGLISEITYETASKYAPIHRNAPEYFQSAMMPLFEGRGAFRTGTECPVNALSSFKGKLEAEYPYILIWRMFNPCND